MGYTCHLQFSFPLPLHGFAFFVSFPWYQNCCPRPLIIRWTLVGDGTKKKKKFLLSGNVEILGSLNLIEQEQMSVIVSSFGLSFYECPWCYVITHHFIYNYNQNITNLELLLHACWVDPENELRIPNGAKKLTNSNSLCQNNKLYI